MPEDEQPEHISSDESSIPLDSSTPHRSSLQRFRNLHVDFIFPLILKNKLGASSRAIAAIVLALVLAGIGYGGIVIDHHLNQPQQHFAAMVTPFTVQNTFPVNGAIVESSHLDYIAIDFNKPMTASKLNGDFWIFPATSGAFSQTGPNEATFTPTKPFLAGTSYNFMIHAEFKSLIGSRLGADFHTQFTTATPAQSVIFNANGGPQTVGSVQVGKDEIYTLSVGSGIDASGQIDIYKTDSAALIDSLRSDNNDLGGKSIDGLYVNPLIDTSNMALVQSQMGLKEGDQLNVDLPIGVYAIVANALGSQVGNSWLVVTDLGIALREDDQQLIVAASSLTTSQPISADVKLYNFSNPQPIVAESTIQSVGSFQTSYGAKYNPNHAQWVVATNGSDFAISALEARWTLADMRVNADLSKSAQGFGLTDKPTYTVGEKVNFSAFLRSDNDVHYQPLAHTNVDIGVQNGDSYQPLLDQVMTTDSNGRVSGTFTVKRDWITSGKSSGSMSIVISDSSSTHSFINTSQLANFTILSKSEITNEVKVEFSKQSYLATDTVFAKLTVRGSTGAKLSNQKVAVNLFTEQYNENSNLIPQISSDYPGQAVNSVPIEVTLDANGQATYPVEVSQLPIGSSHVLTLQASALDNSGNASGEGSATTIVHQGNGKIIFGPTRGVLQSGATLVARVYAETLNNLPIPNAVLQFSLKSKAVLTDGSLDPSGDIQIATGSVTTDANGFGIISQDIGNVSDPSLFLDVWSGDSNNNRIESLATYYVQSSNNSISHSDLQLSTLDISGTSTDVLEGQTLNLTINSPQDIHALVAIDRGRIYKYETVDFKKGDNNYQVVVTADMMPSFNLSFSYFSDGHFKVEGQAFNVSPSGKVVNLQIIPSSTSYKAGSTANVQIKALDSSGNPLKTDLIVGVVNEKMYRLNNQPVGDINTLYEPRETTINSSSSLTGRGSGMSGCGGGPNGIHTVSAAFNPTGSSLLWNPLMSTSTDGIVSISVKLPKGIWRIYVYSMDKTSDIGTAYIDVMAN